MIKIKITRIPEGDAPEEIRKEWVGCILPGVLLAVRGAIDDSLCPLSPSVVDSKGEVKDVSGMLVDTDEAIRILADKNSKAAIWFRLRRPTFGTYFLFQNGEYEVVRAE